MDAVREGALRMLLRVAGEEPSGSIALTDEDRAVQRLLDTGHSDRDIRNALGLTRAELIATLSRLSMA